MGGRGDPRALNWMCGALGPTGAVCGPYDEGVGTRVCLGPWPLWPGKKVKKGDGRRRQGSVPGGAGER